MTKAGRRPGGPRRMYDQVEIGLRPDGFAVMLDRRIARTPGGRALTAPTQGLAELIAAEWRSQDETIEFSTMPATRLAHTALDGVGSARAETASQVVRYAGTDAICYFAEGPQALIRRQEAAWEPLLEWSEAVLGLRFERARGIVHHTQPAETLRRVAALASEEDDFGLAGLAFGSALFGSAVIALALRHGRIEPTTAVEAARLDEAFQEEFWGVDPQNAEIVSRLSDEAGMLGLWFAAVGPRRLVSRPPRR